MSPQSMTLASKLSDISFQNKIFKKIYYTLIIFGCSYTLLTIVLAKIFSSLDINIVFILRIFLGSLIIQPLPFLVMAQLAKKLLQPPSVAIKIKTYYPRLFGFFLATILSFSFCIYYYTNFWIFYFQHHCCLITIAIYLVFTCILMIVGYILGLVVGNIITLFHKENNLT